MDKNDLKPLDGLSMEFEGLSIERAQRIIAINKELEKLQFSGELKRIAEERNNKIKKNDSIT